MPSDGAAPPPLSVTTVRGLHPVGWLAEQGDDQPAPYNWRAVLQLDGMVMPTAGPWFRSEGECLAFIRDDVVGHGMFDGGDGV